MPQAVIYIYSDQPKITCCTFSKFVSLPPPAILLKEDSSKIFCNRNFDQMVRTQFYSISHVTASEFYFQGWF